MRPAAFVILAACGGSAAPAPPRGPAPPPAKATPPAKAAPPAPLPRLGEEGLGGLTGDTLFDVEAIRKEVPELTWALTEGPNGPHIVGSLDGAVAVVARGTRFVESIHVVLPRIGNDFGIALGAPVDALAAKIEVRTCSPDDGPLHTGTPVELSCFVEGTEILLDGDPKASVHVHPGLLAGRRVVGVRIRVAPGPATDAALGVRTPRKRDPAVEKSPLVIDRGAIHPITDLPKITLASLQAALPGMQIAATPDGFAVSRDGAPVLAITAPGGAPARVLALHPSIRSKLGVGVDETFEEAARRAPGGGTASDLAFRLLPLCGSDPTRFAATCALSESSRIELAVAASVRMPPMFMHGGMVMDAWVTSIVWTAPRKPARWPTIDNDAVGGLTPAIARRGDPLAVRAAFPGFDFVGPGVTDGLVWVKGLVGKTEVFMFAMDRIRIFDPRIRLAGIGAGATIREAETAGIGPADCTNGAPAPTIKDWEDSCATKLPRVRLQLAGTRGQRLALRDRRISAILWLADP